MPRTWRERTLDGVVEDYRGWFGGFGGQDCYQDWAKIETDEALGAAAVLLGRRSDEWFAARWLSRTGEWADRLNSMPKYVVSSAVEQPAWNNSTVLKGDVVTEVAALKRELGGDIVV